MIKTSVIIPCRNEEKTIRLLLESLAQQTFPLDQMEVVIADGLSEDRTREEISAFQQDTPGLTVRVVDNPMRTIPAALNIAISAAQGEYIVRLDAHSVPNAEYVAHSVAGLEECIGKNVGGIWKIQPGADTWIAKSIAAAAAHPLGVGDAKYRYTDKAGEVDTVPFGAFRRDLAVEIGGFDETLLSNEDYEFNTRIRQRGGKIWLDPSIQARYYARPTLSTLAKQYWRYGFWKVQMLRRYPETIRWRQAIPPLFVLSLLGSALLSNWWPPAGWIFASVVVLYDLALLAVGLQFSARKKNIAFLVGVPIAIAVMHFSWGSAFLWSLLRSPFKRKP